MSIQNDDLILVNRDGVDYKAKIEELPTGDVDLSEYAKLDDEEQVITSDQYVGKKFQTANPDCYVEGGGFTGPTCDIYGMVQVANVSATSKGQGYFYVQNVAGVSFYDTTDTPYIQGVNMINFDGEDAYINNVSSFHMIDEGYIYGVNRIAAGPATQEIEILSTVTVKAGISATSDISTIGSFIGDGSKLTNLPSSGGDVDLSGYAKLDGEAQEIINTAKFQCQNPSSYHDNSTCMAPNGEFVGSLRATTIGGTGSDTYVSAIYASALTLDQDLHMNNAPIEGASSVTAGEFIGDGSKLTGVMPLNINTLPALP